MFIHKHFIADANSSSHSVIILGEGEEEDDYFDVYNLNFGWSEFTLASPESKAAYLAVGLYHTQVPFDTIQKLVPDLDSQITARDLERGSIDHQSFKDPFDFEAPDLNKPTSMKLWDLFYNYTIRNKSFLILGGNDNSEGSHPLRGEGSEDKVSDVLADFIRRANKSDVVLRWDKDTLVLFDPIDTYRVVLSELENFRGLNAPLLCDF